MTPNAILSPDSRYIIEGRLGSGAMAVVYRARHVHIGTLHAIKVVSATVPSVRARLLREARLQGALSHPNVVAVTDTVDVAGGVALVLEYVDGPSLYAVLEAGTLDVDVVDKLARGLLAGVAAAHSRGMIHRDLKPGNILLRLGDGDVDPKIGDFGLAKALHVDDAKTLDTQAGIAMGTPPYMAPEQVCDARTVDARADVFSLGCVLYEMVTGRRAFRGRSAFEVFGQVIEGRYIPPRELVPTLPERMCSAIERALRTDPCERYADAGQLLSAWEDGTRAPSPTFPITRWRALAAGSLRPLGAEDVLSDSTFGSMALQVSAVPATAVTEPPLEGPPTLGLMAAHGLGAALLAAPFAFGTIGLVFGGIGGVVTNPLAMTVVAAHVFFGGAQGVLSVRHSRQRSSLWALWLIGPLVVAFIGSWGAGREAERALALLADAPLADRADVAAAGLVATCETALAGMGGATTMFLGLMAASVANLRLTPHSGPWDSRRGVMAGAVTVFAGCATWLVAEFTFASSGGHFLVFLAVVAVAIAYLGVPTRDGPRSHEDVSATVLAGIAGVVAAAMASHMTNLFEQVAIFRAIGLDARLPLDLVSDALRLASVGRSGWQELGWGLAAAAGAAVVSWHALRAGWRALRPARELGALVPLVALFFVAFAQPRANVNALLAAAEPAFLESAAGASLGVELDASAVEPTVAVADPGTGLAVGDVILAVAGRRVETIPALIEAIEGCRCGRSGLACAVAPGCLVTGATVDLTVARLSAEGTVLHTVTIGLPGPR